VDYDDLEKLGSALRAIGDPPCEGCEFASACAEGLACKDFQIWSGSGRLPKRPKAGNRIPKVSIYEKIFELKLLRKTRREVRAAA
jgi:hypothetical protein